MTQQYKWTLQRILSAVWLFLAVATAVVAIQPLNYSYLRLFFLIAMATLYGGAIFLLRHHKRIMWSLVLLAVLGCVFLVLPGRRPDVARLRVLYVKSLGRYEGTPYIWSGEDAWGIDCSGLVRRAFVDANLWLGLTTLNPQPVRMAFSIWWHDCTAQALRVRYRNWTQLLFTAENINAIRNPSLRPGDLAVTKNGVHVLAYLGDQVWIEADPGFGRVIQMKAPNGDRWFNTSVHVLRWAQLQ